MTFGETARAAPARVRRYEAASTVKGPKLYEAAMGLRVSWEGGRDPLAQAVRPERLAGPA
jgi:hypothetical protein